MTTEEFHALHELRLLTTRLQEYRYSGGMPPKGCEFRYRRKDTPTIGTPSRQAILTEGGDIIAKYDNDDITLDQKDDIVEYAKLLGWNPLVEKEALFPQGTTAKVGDVIMIPKPFIRGSVHFRGGDELVCTSTDYYGIRFDNYKACMEKIDSDKYIIIDRILDRPLPTYDEYSPIHPLGTQANDGDEVVIVNNFGGVTGKQIGMRCKAAFWHGSTRRFEKKIRDGFLHPIFMMPLEYVIVKNSL